MLKDITLGQFFPGNTLVHRLDPRTKLACVALYIVALLTAKSFLAYGVIAVALIMYAWRSARQRKAGQLDLADDAK